LGYIKNGDLLLSSQNLRRLQTEQFAHDRRNHSDVFSLPKAARLKHYGLHYAKYAGRLARMGREEKPIRRTLVDCFLINLSAANTLAQDLSVEVIGTGRSCRKDEISRYVDAMGRFADACEKLDHLEDFWTIARTANRDITDWLVSAAREHDIDLSSAAAARREEIASKLFFIAD
jgi:hypothetical protein